MNPMDNELQCKKCGKPIKGGCYNVPDGPFVWIAGKIRSVRNLKGL